MVSPMGPDSAGHLPPAQRHRPRAQATEGRPVAQHRRDNENEEEEEARRQREALLAGHCAASASSSFPSPKETMCCWPSAARYQRDNLAPLPPARCSSSLPCAFLLEEGDEGRSLSPQPPPYFHRTPERRWPVRGQEAQS